MSETQTGGDGSVKWKVKADSVKQHNSKHEKTGFLEHEGIDDSGECGRDWFTVSIEVPEGFTDAGEYLRALKGDGPMGLRTRGDDHVYFNLPIRRKHNEQVVVAWGKSDRVYPPDPNSRKAD